MILDRLTNWNLYLWPNERFAQGFEYLISLDPAQEAGKYPIDGENLFCMVQNYDTTPAEGQEFEAHRQYADIQILLDGEESILWAPQDSLSVSKPYTEDAELYHLVTGGTEIVLKPGLFCVLLPGDAHAPCIAHGKPAQVKKVVVKVKL